MEKTKKRANFGRIISSLSILNASDDDDDDDDDAQNSLVIVDDIFDDVNDDDFEKKKKKIFVNKGLLLQKFRFGACVCWWWWWWCFKDKTKERERETFMSTPFSSNYIRPVLKNSLNMKPYTSLFKGVLYSLGYHIERM